MFIHLFKTDPMKTKFFFSRLLLSAFSLFFSFMSFSQGTWVQKTNFGGIARADAVAFSIGTAGYIGTGWDWNQNMYKDFWAYDTTTNAWTQKADFGGTARFGAVGFSIGTKGYIGTGISGPSPSYQNDFWEYSPSSNTWTQKANFTGIARCAAVGFSIGTKGYVGTGDNGTSFFKDFREYDPATDSWAQKANFGGTARDSAVGFSIGSKGYIGTGYDGMYKKDFWEYDPSGDVWTQKANFGGAARSCATGFSIGTRAYVGTGWGGWLDPFIDFWEYNPATDLWAQMANFIGTRRSRAVGFSIGTKGYFGTGWDSGHCMNDFWEYIPRDPSYSLLSGKVFSDTNSNCVQETGEALLANWFVEAKSASNVFYGLTGGSGTYEIWIPAGTYSVSLIPKNYWQQVCPAIPPAYTASVLFQDTVANLDFGAGAVVSCPDLAVSIGSGTFRRCLKNNFYALYWNDGTTAAINALLKITFDSGMIPLSSTVPWDSISGNSYFWKVSSVLPGQHASIGVVDSIYCYVHQGDTLHSYAQWLNVPGDCNDKNNTDEDHHVVTGSFDPNAKEACTGSHKVYTRQAAILPSDTIHYAIHFQNTGTDTAFKVVVYDTLDADLDIPSVISGAGSHPYTFALLGAGVLRWTFNNILLPDSNINEPLSHGFVKFQILQQPNNPNGTVINNHAGIVFDFNLPVLTDTVVLVVDDLSGSTHEIAKENAFLIYPNPTTGKLVIRNDKLIAGSLAICNVLGEKIYQTKITDQTLEINLNDQPNGIYFLQLIFHEESVNKKIIIQR